MIGAGDNCDRRANCLIGTSSFSEVDWVGPFYPLGSKPSAFLALYSQHFPTVEIDAIYYAVPTARTVENWAKVTPDNFVLAAKFPRAIVHCGEGSTPNPAAILLPDATYSIRDHFLEAMNRMGNRLGPLLLQFPYFSKAVFPNASEFVERLERFLGDLPSGFEFAVEIRNRYWLNEQFAALLRRHGVALVLTDQTWMPHGDEVVMRLDPITADYVYIRLLGDRKEIEAVTTSWDKIVIDRTERLERWATLVADFLIKGYDTLIYANNHYEGFAPESAENLKQMIENRLSKETPPRG